MPEKRVQLTCKGRGFDGEEILPEGVLVTIRLNKRPDSEFIFVGPENCPYNTGGHGQRCKAAHPEEDKVSKGAFCAFSFDYPFVLEFKPDWQLPAELVGSIEEMEQPKARSLTRKAMKSLTLLRITVISLTVTTVLQLDTFFQALNVITLIILSILLGKLMEQNEKGDEGKTEQK